MADSVSRESLNLADPNDRRPTQHIVVVPGFTWGGSSISEFTYRLGRESNVDATYADYYDKRRSNLFDPREVGISNPTAVQRLAVDALQHVVSLDVPHAQIRLVGFSLGTLVAQEMIELAPYFDVTGLTSGSEDERMHVVMAPAGSYPGRRDPMVVARYANSWLGHGRDIGLRERAFADQAKRLCTEPYARAQETVQLINNKVDYGALPAYALLFADDRVFRPEIQAPYLKSQGVPVTIIGDVKLGHSAPYTHSEQVAEAAAYLII